MTYLAQRASWGQEKVWGKMRSSPGPPEMVTKWLRPRSGPGSILVGFHFGEGWVNKGKTEKGLGL
jgi:hypothetical protein